MPSCLQPVMQAAVGEILSHVDLYRNNTEECCVCLPFTGRGGWMIHTPCFVELGCAGAWACWGFEGIGAKDHDDGMS